MRGKLLINAGIKYFAGLLLIGMLIFLPAGTFEYWNGWLFIGLLFVPMFFLGVILLWKAPALLEKRLSTKEKEGSQQTVVALSGLLFLIGFVASGLDFRFGWTRVPVWLGIAASVILLVSYGLYAEVMRENAYLSRTVEVQENQKVVDTGLYGVVRHPMYAVTILLFLSFPLVLGSWIGFVLFLHYPILIAARIKNEEMVLEQGLEGYAEYKKRVKYRIIPFIW